MFSVTYSKEIRTLTREFLHHPVSIEIAPEKPAAELVAQRAYRCDVSSKAQLTVHLIKEGKWEQVLVFTRTRHGANRLSKKLMQSGIQASETLENAAKRKNTHFLNRELDYWFIFDRLPPSPNGLWRGKAGESAV